MAGDDVDAPPRERSATADARGRPRHATLRCRRPPSTPVTGIVRRRARRGRDRHGRHRGRVRRAPRCLRRARLAWMLRIIGQPAALLDGGLDDAPIDERIGAAVPEPVAACACVVARGGVGGRPRGRCTHRRGRCRRRQSRRGQIRRRHRTDRSHRRPHPRRRQHPLRWQSPRRSVPARRPIFAARFASVADDPQAIVHCGSGVTACHNALAMESAGLPLPRVYVGSWSGWISDPDHPDRHRSTILTQSSFASGFVTAGPRKPRRKR